MMSGTEIQSLNDAHVLNTYGTRKIAMVRGAGTRLWDADGNEYLDFFTGIAVANLGHCHPAVTDAIREQAGKLVHVSNLYYIEPQVELARLLSEHSFAERWFFCNSGAEANEAAVKLARRYWSKKGTPRPTVVTALQSFHGRTLAMIAASGQDKLRDGFAPIPEGFKHVPFNDLNALDRALTPDVGAVMLEIVQGEGGVNPAPAEYLQAVRERCDATNTLLILDEIQTGMGRTGHFFAHQGLGFEPDIVTLAKGLGNGVPIGAMGCTEDVSSGFDVGSHGCTFGGNPLSTAAAVATVRTITQTGFLEQARQEADYLRQKLNALKQKHEVIVEVRGMGMMLGIALTKPVAPLLGMLLERGLIAGPAGPNVLRLLPALIITRGDIDRGVDILDQALEEF